MTSPLYLAVHEADAWMLWEHGAHTYGLRLDPGEPRAAIRIAAFVLWGDDGRAVEVRVLPAEAVARMLEHLRPMPTIDQTVRAPAGLREWLRERGRALSE